MTPLASPFWSFSPTEFRCRGCGGHEAYRSRPRGFFERYILRLMFLQAVRCDRCYLRSYISLAIDALDRPQPARMLPKAPAPGSGSDSRIA